MTSFRFVHAADLHLGSPFQGLAVKDPDVANRFAEATRNAWAALVGRAVEEKIGFLVIAGDVYDGEWKDSSVGLFFNREVARLHRAGIPVFLLKGNHDAESVVSRSVALPASIREFPTRAPATFQLDGLKVALHGQGFAERAANQNLALTYPPAVPGWFNIGVLHTSLTGRPPHANYAPCSLDDLRSRGYDYWALGHVHEFEIVARDPTVVFPGNLQGRNIRESGAKGAVMVAVEDGAVVSVERLLVDEARWASATLDIEGLADRAALLNAIEAELAPLAVEAEGKLLALRLQLTGENELRRWLLANRGDFTVDVQAVCHHLHPDIWLEKLDIRVVAPAAASAPSEGPSFDLETLLRDLRDDPLALEMARAVVAEVAAKLPHGVGARSEPLGDDVASLLAEACDVLSARAAVGR